MKSLDLPLFPLGQVVLAPAMPLQLHIFESRYKALTNVCLEGDRRFGVVLIREGTEVGETASPYTVGTIATIVAATRFDDGRFFLSTEGGQRFRILERFYDRAYLHATVELLDEPIGLQESVRPLARAVRRLARDYFGMVLRLEGEDSAEVTFPEDPVDLSYKVLSALQIVDQEKQLLLEAPDAEERLRQEEQILQRELLILDRMLHLPQQQSSFFHPN